MGGACGTQVKLRPLRGGKTGKTNCRGLIILKLKKRVKYEVECIQQPYRCGPLAVYCGFNHKI